MECLQVAVSRGSRSALLSGRWANRARAGNGGLQAKSRIHTIGHLRPFMPQKTRVGNDRSQSTTAVARRRNRNKKLYKAGARSSVTLAAQNADRRAAVSEIELALSTLSRLCAGEDRTFNRSQRETFGYSMTLSARNSTVCGIVRSSARAVFMLITKVNVVGRSIGMSAGLAPLRILSTKAAARR